jgi:DNA-binding transcriptional LysR family regulator
MPSFDLNLVRVFDALTQQRSVSGAAAALNLTQPAVSNALRRLRALTHDDLFVRTRRGMEPTAYSIAAGPSLAEGLRLIRASLERAAPFDPASTRRRFRMLMNEAGELVFLPRLLPWLQAHAPLMDIQVIQLPPTRYLEALETDQADLAIGSLKLKGEALVLKRLFDQRYLIACRAGHPLIEGAARPDYQKIAATPHVLVRLPNSQTTVLDLLERAHGWKTRVVLEVPHYMVLPGILEATDFVSVVPSLVAKELSRRAALATLPLPEPSPQITIRLAWHTRQQKDPGSRWLRQQIVDLMTHPPPS